MSSQHVFSISLNDPADPPKIIIEFYEEVDSRAKTTCLLGYCIKNLPLAPGCFELQLPLISPDRSLSQKLLKVSKQFLFKDFFAEEVSR